MAQSGGKNEQNWYNQGNADDNLLIQLLTQYK